MKKTLTSVSQLINKNEEYAGTFQRENIWLLKLYADSKDKTGKSLIEIQNEHILGTVVLLERKAKTLTDISKVETIHDVARQILGGYIFR